MDKTFAVSASLARIFNKRWDLRVGGWLEYFTMHHWKTAAERPVCVIGNRRPRNQTFAYMLHHDLYLKNYS